MRFKTIFDTYEEKQGIIFKEPTMTIQSEKDNCDINVIMNRYATCGTPLPYRTDGVEPVYADVSELGDYMENFQRCKQAEEMFNALPSALRKELDNNPANLIPFIQNKENESRCIEYGLINKPIMEAPEASVVVNSNPANPVSGDASGAILHSDSNVIVDFLTALVAVFFIANLRRGCGNSFPLDVTVPTDTIRHSDDGSLNLFPVKGSLIQFRA